MINSPCNSNCKLDQKTNLCLGCFRTMDEILNWVYYKDNEKILVIEKASKRKIEQKGN